MGTFLCPFGISRQRFRYLRVFRSLVLRFFYKQTCYHHLTLCITLRTCSGVHTDRNWNHSQREGHVVKTGQGRRVQQMCWRYMSTLILHATHTYSRWALWCGSANFPPCNSSGREPSLSAKSSVFPRVFSNGFGSVLLVCVSSHLTRLREACAWTRPTRIEAQSLQFHVSDSCL